MSSTEQILWTFIFLKIYPYRGFRGLNKIITKEYSAYLITPAVSLGKRTKIKFSFHFYSTKTICQLSLIQFNSTKANTQSVVIAHRKICGCGRNGKMWNIHLADGQVHGVHSTGAPEQGLTSTRLALITVTSRVAQFGRDNHLLFDLHISRMWTRIPKQPDSQDECRQSGSQSAS